MDIRAANAAISHFYEHFTSVRLRGRAFRNIQGATGVMKLASNESALGPSAKARVAYEAASAELHRYPDGASQELRQAIGRVYGIDPAQIVCGAGSDEIPLHLR